MSESYVEKIARLREEAKRNKSNSLSGLGKIAKDLKNDEGGTTLKAKAVDSEKPSVVSQRPDLAASDIDSLPKPPKSGFSLAMDKAKSGLSSATGSLAKIDSKTLGAADAGGQEVAKIVDPEGEGAATVASTALTGASIGSVVPGVGTAIGAVVGLGLGLVKAESNKKANQAKRELAAAGIMGEALQRQTDFRQLRLGQLGSSQSRDLKF
jgi:hypothetical protein